MNVNAVFVRSFVIPFNKWRIEGVWCNRVVNLCLCSMLSIKHKWVKLDLWDQTPPPLLMMFFSLLRTISIHGDSLYNHFPNEGGLGP